MTAHQFEMKTIDGKTRDFSAYRGKVMLIVNVASECGYTPQYKGLEALHKKLASKGLAVVGVPCNQFGEQEPGTEKEIASFCEKSFGVTFDLMSKVDVNGPNAHPLFKWLTQQGDKPGDIKWNFAKFVVDKQGRFVARFSHRVEPDAPELMAAIEKVLAQ